MSAEAPLDAAGKVDIQELTLISGGGLYITLASFLIELNLFEDIYSGGLYGNVVLSDSIGLINNMTLVGEEYITIKIDTPNFGVPIWKTFRCCGIENRVFTRDTTTEAYMIHFVSPEVFLDQFSPVQRAFSGNVDDIVEKIYQQYLWHPRNLDIQDGKIVDSKDNTELSIFTECKTPVKFISPSWSPMKCLSWLASKVVSSDPMLPAANFLFFESNKRFYWGSLEDMIVAQRGSGKLFGIYSYAPGNVKGNNTDSVTVSGATYRNPDIARDYFSVHELKVLKNVDMLNNQQNGYLASAFHELDLSSKTYKETTYDHITRYPYYNHTQAEPNGFFSTDAVRSPYTHQIIGFKYPGLFDGTKNNLNERASAVKPIRTSMMAEMDQVKLKIDVHGRTDIELGTLIYLAYPKSGPKSEDDKNQDMKDKFYSGLYLITAIHHKITIGTHSMTMEIIKDSFGDLNPNKT